MQKFLYGRIRLVKELLQSDLAVTYADLTLILCAVLSACAARRWPRQGRNLDKARFVSLLVKYSPPEFHTSWISVPALLNDGLITESETPWGRPGQATRVYCDEEIDLSIEDAELRYPLVSAVRLKEYSYASLIYRWLRCGYSHEYCAHDSITEIQASRRISRLSYIGRSTGKGIKRMVAFHLDYLIRLAEYHVSILPRHVS
jgi:hypothetical protein